MRATLRGSPLGNKRCGGMEFDDYLDDLNDDCCVISARAVTGEDGRLLVDDVV